MRGYEYSKNKTILEDITIVSNVSNRFVDRVGISNKSMCSFMIRYDGAIMTNCVLSIS